MTFATRRPSPCRLALVGCLLAASWTGAEELYRTDFDDKGFTPDTGWVGHDSWIGINTGGDGHGIVEDIIPGLGMTGFVGWEEPTFAIPTFPLVSMLRAIPYDPGPGDLPVVEVETLIGIQDSIYKSARDSFIVGVWNGNGDFLAGVRFSNATASFGIWRLDGTASEDYTGIEFIRGELHLLRFRTDLPNNRWSAELLQPDPETGTMHATPLFHDVPFHAGTYPVDCGYLSYEWQISAGTAAGYGDNWMLVADILVRTTGWGIVPFRFTGFECNGGGVQLEWPGEIGFEYQVEYSDDGATWHDNLADSSFSGITADGPLNFTDTTCTTRRLYRVIRTETW